MEDTRERNGPVPPAPGGSDADLLEYGRIVWRRRRLLLSIVGAFLLLAIVKTFLTPPSYAARTLLDVEKEIPGEMDFRQTSVYAMWDPEFYQTQYDLLQSRGLAERVVTTLKLADRPDFNTAKSSFWKPRACRWWRARRAWPRTSPTASPNRSSAGTWSANSSRRARPRGSWRRRPNN